MNALTYSMIWELVTTDKNIFCNFKSLTNCLFMFYILLILLFGKYFLCTYQAPGMMLMIKVKRIEPFT